MVSLYTRDLIRPVLDWEDIPLQTYKRDQIFAVNIIHSVKSEYERSNALSVRRNTCLIS